MKKKITLFLLLMLYLTSFFLSYVKVLDRLTADFVSQTGFQVIGVHAVAYSVFALLIICFVIFTLRLPKYSMIPAVLIVVQFIYLSTRNFFTVPGSLSLTIHYILYSFQFLQIGYYVNTTLGMILVIILIIYSIKKTKRTQ